MSLTLQLHPDWPFGDGLVIESIARDGVYRSQFETGTSNGGLTAHAGGDRWRWESRLFGGRYDDRPASERPVYGAWNRRADPYGGAIRFGSAHVRLRPHVVQRATFCFPDSFLEPEHHGGPEVLDHLCALADRSGFDDLDDYVEAHAHGGVVVADDVEAVVLDPCFRDGPVHEAAERLGCAVEWHPGFEVHTCDLPEDYRGPEPLALARSLARSTGDVLVPATVGGAARSGRHDPQTVKCVWHLLARFGRRTVRS
ncbi:DUF3626 domain-containing protein [Nocardioides rubriscoriae]|uniref:DUF3626 domain-containing protein n=1 Tax=Nocardioides rubriscoriae TaxID=642762 RepID=UPI0011DF53C5|nr:DUF3626 domain-containing protein [Nocardioides rubriscoriae]